MNPTNTNDGGDGLYGGHGGDDDRTCNNSQLFTTPSSTKGVRRTFFSRVFLETDDLTFYILGYLDVVSLVKKKVVSQHWNKYCTMAIDRKLRNPQDAMFQTNRELIDAVHKYCGNEHDHIEEIACQYGYPIGKWNVSQVQDFAVVFSSQYHFNEDIGSWDVSNATDMAGMFIRALQFNKDISNWDVSNVRSMNGMFWRAYKFDQDLSSWNVSNVTNMDEMFYYANQFHPNTISCWDTSQLRHAKRMFTNKNIDTHLITSWNLQNLQHDPKRITTSNNNLCWVCLVLVWDCLEIPCTNLCCLFSLCGGDKICCIRT